MRQEGRRAGGRQTVLSTQGGGWSCGLGAAIEEGTDIHRCVYRDCLGMGVRATWNRSLTVLGSRRALNVGANAQNAMRNGINHCQPPERHIVWSSVRVIDCSITRIRTHTHTPLRG